MFTIVRNGRNWKYRKRIEQRRRRAIKYANDTFFSVVFLLKSILHYIDMRKRKEAIRKLLALVAMSVGREMAKKKWEKQIKFNGKIMGRYIVKSS